MVRENGKKIKILGVEKYMKSPFEEGKMGVPSGGRRKDKAME